MGSLYFAVTARQARELLDTAHRLASRVSTWRPVGYLVNGLSISYLPDPPGDTGKMYYDSDETISLHAVAATMPEPWAAELLHHCFPYDLV